MCLKNKPLDKIYKALVYVAIGILTLLAVFSFVSPFATALGNWFTNLFYAILIPVAFLLGHVCKKKKYLSLEDALIGVGALIAIIVFVSMIATWINYGFFHTLVYKEKPIYYLNGNAYDITKEVLFLSSLKFEHVSVNYACTFGVLCGAYLPATFFINRKKNSKKFYISLVIGIIGVISLATIPNFYALIILGGASLFALIYKFYWQNKKVINIIRYCILGLLVAAIIFYLVAGINVLAGFKFEGFMDDIFVSNAVMSKVTTVLDGMNLKEEAKLINFFGLNFSYAVASVVEEIALTQTGVFEVELIKEVGAIGVTLVLLFITISFRSFDKQLSDGENSDFERVGSSVLFFSLFVYCSLFYDSMPYVYNNYYSPVLRFVPFLIVLFLLGLVYFYPKETKETKNEK